MKEAELIKRAKKKDAAAISKLYSQNIDCIYRFVYYKTGLREIAEDITSEAFVKAFESIDKFQGKSSFKTWVYAIARNLVIKWYKHKGINTSLIYEPIEETEDNFKENSDSERNLKAIFLNIKNERYKKVLELRFLLNYSIRETAEELKITEGNVKVIQNRALKKARKAAENMNLI